jgi:uncharacterized membrane protein YqhA
VIGLLVSSCLIFFVGAIETGNLVVLMVKHVIGHGLHFDSAIYNKIIVHIIMTVDDFLLGTVLLIFGLGTYDLFISRIEIAEETAQSSNIRRPDWLKFKSLEELKSILGKVVLMILTINFLKFVVNSDFQDL